MRFLYTFKPSVDFQKGFLHTFKPLNCVFKRYSINH